MKTQSGELEYVLTKSEINKLMIMLSKFSISELMNNFGFTEEEAWSLDKLYGEWTLAKK